MPAILVVGRWIKINFNMLQQIESIKKDFSQFGEWEDKYKYIIKIGKNLTPMSLDLKSDANLIKGCVSKVWLFASLSDENKIIFMADSDAAITKGIIALLLKAVSNSTPQQILSNDFSFVEEIGLSKHLSFNRANGLSSMLKQIKMYAIAFNAKLNM